MGKFENDLPNVFKQIIEIVEPYFGAPLDAAMKLSAGKDDPSQVAIQAIPNIDKEVKEFEIVLGNHKYNGQKIFTTLVVAGKFSEYWLQVKHKKGKIDVKVRKKPESIHHPLLEAEVLVVELAYPEKKEIETKFFLGNRPTRIGPEVFKDIDGKTFNKFVRKFVKKTKTTDEVQRILERFMVRHITLSNALWRVFGGSPNP